MKPPWRHSSPAIPILFWVAVALLTYAPFKAGLVTFKQIADNKDLIDALSTIVGTTALILGASFSYIRFFKGRILKPKLDLDLRVECIPNRFKNLYSLEIAITNRGSVSVWNFRTSISVRSHPLSTRQDISNTVIPSTYIFQDHLVSVGETTFEHAVVELDKKSLAYTFEVVILDDENTMWRRCLTVKNQ